MIFDAYIRKLIREKLNCDLSQPSQFEALSEDIYRVTKEHLGVNTLKRLWGILPEVNATQTTLNILSRYLGYTDWHLLTMSLDGKNSSFNDDDAVFLPSHYPHGTDVIISYAPDREISIRLLTEETSEVLSVHGGKLKVGDILHITSITIGSPFVIKDVIREGQSLGHYTGGIEGGVTKIHISDS